jgi:ubiquinone/menaquinone biosynthesis C-methylase UbiE
MKADATQSFDAFAETYDRIAALTGGDTCALIETVLPKEGGRAVDLGCGSGHHASILGTRFEEVLAVDISSPMLDIARARRARPNVRYELRDLEDVTPERDGLFDLVFSVKTLHHVPALEDALRAIRRLVNPGGRVVLLDIVASQPSLPRWWFRREALRYCAGEAVNRRRPVREALELLRLLNHPEWLDHVTTDRFLSPAEFRQQYGRVFPGGQFTDLYFACLLTWQDGQPADSADEHDLVADGNSTSGGDGAVGAETGS